MFGRFACFVGKHKWNEWEYAPKNMCAQSRTCGRCGTMENQIKHIWNEWKYETPEICKRICSRCSEVEALPHHWVYQSEYGAIDQDWDGHPVNGVTGSYDKCERCGSITNIEKIGENIS